MREQRITYPQAKIAYHSVFEVASTDKDAFGVKLEHEVFFIPAFTGDDDGGQSQPVNQGTLVGQLPTNTFDNSHCVVATWAVKWPPRVWALSVHWSSSRKHATSLQAMPCL